MSKSAKLKFFIYICSVYEKFGGVGGKHSGFVD